MRSKTTTIKLWTTEDVARHYGIATQVVRQRARRYRVGQKIGPTWVFSDADVIEMRTRGPGGIEIGPRP